MCSRYNKYTTKVKIYYKRTNKFQIFEKRKMCGDDIFSFPDGNIC